MAQCECLEKCPFFLDQMENMPALAQQLKQRFCMADWASCARHLVFEALGPGRAPATLFPVDVARAREVIAANR